MSIDNFSIPELLKRPDETPDTFSGQEKIGKKCKNYVESLKLQGIEGEELDLTIQEITKLLEKQDGEINECNMKFLHLKEGIVINPQIEKNRLKLELALNFFNNSSELQEIQDTLQNEVGLDLTNVLNGYKIYIEKNILGAENSDLSKEELIYLVEKIKLSIINKINQIGIKISELKENDTENMLNNRWILNSEIKSILNEVNDKFLPSAVFLINYSSFDKNEYGLSNDTITLGDKDFSVRLSDKKKQIEEMFASEVDSEGNFNEGFWSLQTDTINTSGLEGEKIAELYNIDTPEQASLLNEKDKEIENEATVAMLCFCVCSCIPYIGAGISVPNDFMEIFTSKDQTIERLKNMDCVDKNYNVSKGWDVHLLAILSIVATFAGATALVKSKKMAELMKKIHSSGLSSDKISAIMKKVSGKMGLGKDDTSKLINETPNTTNMNIPNYKNQLDGSKQVDNFDNLPEKISDIQSNTKAQVEKVLARNEGLTEDIIKKNSGLNDIDRIKGLKNDFKLNDKQIEKVIDIHHNMDGILLEHSSHEWWAKIGAMGEIGIDRRTAIKIMDYGYAGKFNITGVPDDIVKVLGINPRAKDMLLEMNVIATRISLKGDIKQMEILADYLKENPDKYKNLPSANLGLLNHRIKEIKDIQSPKKMLNIFGPVTESQLEEIVTLHKNGIDDLNDILKSLKKDFQKGNKIDSWDNRLQAIHSFGKNNEDIRAEGLFTKNQNNNFGTTPLGNALLSRIEQIEQKINDMKQVEMKRSQQFNKVAEVRQTKETAGLVSEIKEVSFDNMNEFIKEIGNTHSLLKENGVQNQHLKSYFLDNLNPDMINQKFGKLGDVEYQKILISITEEYNLDALSIFISKLKELGRRIDKPKYIPDDNLLKTIGILDGSGQKSQLFKIGRIIFQGESSIKPAIEKRVSQLIQGLLQIQSDRLANLPNR